MTCGETREILFAFLDNELDAPLSIELQRHLDGCPGCAREAEIERVIGKRLGSAIETAGGEVPVLEERLEPVLAPCGDVVHPNEEWRIPQSERLFEAGAESARVETRGSPFARPLPYGRGSVGRLATAAAILLMAGAGTWYLIERGAGARSQPRFADLAVSDFEHFVSEGSVLQVTSGDPATVASWLRQKTALAVILPAMGDSGCKLLGGRKCKIDNRPAAFAVYDLNGLPASLVAVAARDGQFEGMKAVHHAGSTHWVDHCEGYTVVAGRRGELVYAAVATAGEEELVRLIQSTVHESD